MQEVSLRGRIFFGWWLLVGLFLIYMASNGILLNTIPRIFPNLASEFGWTNEQVTLPANMFFALVAFLNPVAGWFLDRFSIRRLMLIGALGITLVLALFPLVQEWWHLMALYVLFGFSLSLAGLSPSLMLLSRWFVRYRGLAFGILMMASSFGGAVFPWVVNFLLPDWRLAVLVLAVVGGAMMILPTLFLVSNYPRDKGLAADGVADPEPEARPKPDAFGKVVLSLIRSPVFYLLAFATGTLWFCIVAMLNNQALFFRNELLLDDTSTTTIYSSFFAAAIVGKVLFGYLADKFNKLWVTMASVLNLGLGLALLFLAVPGETTWPLAYAIVYGVGYSGAFTMIQLMIAEFYAGRNYGVYLGIFLMIDSLAGAVGGRFLATSADQYGSFTNGFTVMMILCAIAVACVYILIRRQRA